MIKYLQYCGGQSTFDNKHISQRTGKKIPLDPGTNEPHDCPVRGDQPQQQPPSQQQLQQRRYLQSNKGCGNEIYFDANNKTQSCKWIPIDKDTGLPHTNRYLEWIDQYEDETWHDFARSIGMSLAKEQVK
jgi:hypothetical protein